MSNFFNPPIPPSKIPTKNKKSCGNCLTSTEGLRRIQQKEKETEEKEKLKQERKEEREKKAKAKKSQLEQKRKQKAKASKCFESGEVFIQ